MQTPAPLDPSPIAAGDRQIDVDTARAAIAGAIHAAMATSGRGPGRTAEPTPLAQAAGRVLAADVISPIDVPAHDNSAMDGFAFDGAALRAEAAIELRVAGTLHAGRPYAGRIGAGECLRIMTGAVMPDGLDTVVPFELAQASADGGLVRIEPGRVARGDNRRRRGEDLARGGIALPAGRWLKPADIGLAASLGLVELPLAPKLRVALFSTGDEIAAPGSAAGPGQVYDSNRPALAALLARLPVEVLDLGLVRDEPAVLEAALADALAHGADAVLTSGGVSAGDADHTRAVLERLGEVAFWKVAMRPGRPFAFGPLSCPAGAGDGRPAWLFALPGNPVAALVTFHAFVRDALLQLAGATPHAVPLVPLPCTAPIRKRPGRTEFQRALVERDGDGRLTVRPFPQQGAGVLRSLAESQGLIVLAHDQASVEPGALVPVWLFDGLV